MNDQVLPQAAAHGRCPRAQRGVVLFFALIALVAMTLAALAFVRSVDTSNLVAGNVALKQGAIQEADKIMNTAFACLDSGGALLAVSLAANNATCNYYASLQPDATKPFNIPDVLESAAGTTDPATGNTSAYVIERMCSAVGNWSPSAPASCAESPFGKSAAYHDGRLTSALTPPQGLYRISIKVSGPRNVVTYSQMIMNAGV
jgi:type IV pilus assembly protein PilX